mmetsp:Transcript_46842/g.69663  ORF Transcript_46842/g.69663 Transcript_46842/m.69663 type:complete len:80 (+) Transcript_46842:66-305(+)
MMVLIIWRMQKHVILLQTFLTRIGLGLTEGRPLLVSTRRSRPSQWNKLQLGMSKFEFVVVGEEPDERTEWLWMAQRFDV